jgi:ATP-dependent DNA helicase RecQ
MHNHFFDTLSPQIGQLARTMFGYEALHPEQSAAIQSVLAGRDTLVNLPTSQAKSEIYQIAALLLSGTTIIISPLITLQSIQKQPIVVPAGTKTDVINSLMSIKVSQSAFNAGDKREVEFLFLSPEQFNDPALLPYLYTLRPSLFVVDEAHRISSQNDAFSADYLRLGQIIELLGHPVVLALTSTTSFSVQNDIVSRLGLQQPQIIVQDFKRPRRRLPIEKVSTQADAQQISLQPV